MVPPHSKLTANFLPYGRQTIEDDDIAAVVEVLRSDFLTTGPKVQEFETALAEKLGAKHAIACSNGTAALHLALMALGVAAGDKVIVPAITFVATANAVRMCGAEVIFADVSPHSGLMELEHFEAAIKRAGGHVKAVIPVHLTGQCADMAAIKAHADKQGIKIITDACHAVGTEYSGELGTGFVGGGQYEGMACFSFHPVKTIAMGEGGAITTNSDHYAQIIRSLVSHGIWQIGEAVVNEDLAFDENENINPWYHEFHRLGWNYRASDIHCALGLSQLKKIDRFIEKRRALVARYTENIKNISNHIKPIRSNKNCLSAWHLFPILIDFDKLSISKSALMHRLREHNIGTQVHYIPVPFQAIYKAENEPANFVGAIAYYEKTLSLPLFPAMELEDVDYVVTNLNLILK